MSVCFSDNLDPDLNQLHASHELDLYVGETLVAVDAYNVGLHARKRPFGHHHTVAFHNTDGGFHDMVLTGKPAEPIFFIGAEGNDRAILLSENPGERRYTREGLC